MSGWPADQIIKRSLSELSASAHNSRTHSEAQIAKLVDAINEWGWTVPVVVDENGQLIAGHGRIMAAERLGVSEVPCVVAAGWTDAQKRAYVIADNRIAELSGWDESILRQEVIELNEMDFELDLLGFDAPDVSSFLFAPDGGASFLDDMTGGLNDGPSTLDPSDEYTDKHGAKDADGKGVNLTFVMPAEDRDVVVAWLSNFRETHSLKTQAQALAEMAKKEITL